MQSALWVLMIVNILYSVFLTLRIKRIKRNDMQFFADRAKELEDVVSNADLMVSELNNLSDYVVTRVEEANARLVHTMKQIEERINDGRELITTIDLKHNTNQKFDVRIQETVPVLSNVDSGILKKVQKNKVEKSPTAMTTSVVSGSKQEQAVQLADQGMSIREIAKVLNIGQGEVQLLLGIRNK